MERISALMDGELDIEDQDAELRRIKGNEDLMQNWETYHLIGDVLRQERVLGTGFSDRLRATLEKEPTVLAPRPVASARKTRLYALSAAASVAGVAAVGWLAFMNHPGSLDGGVGAIASKTPSAAFAPAVAVTDADASVDEYIRVHHAYSPSAAIPGIAPYVRNVKVNERDMAR
jgi:sigma-E factor negative regulatory protein RseA